MSSQISTSVPRLNRAALEDIDLPSIDWDTVACAVFACGTEERCTAILNQMPQQIYGRAIVLEFEDNSGADAHKRSYLERITPQAFITPQGDVRFIIEHIQTLLYSARPGQDYIFVDISSMPRLWYLGIIMWARFSGTSFRLLLGYAGGSYSDSYPERQIIGLRSVTGTGGFYDASQPVWTIMCLGFDAGAALSVEDRIEPDRIISVIAKTTDNTAERTRTEELNQDLISRSDTIIYLPHMSFSNPFRGLSELISPIDRANIVCVPLGPKTHVVACALAGLVFPRAANVQVQSRYTNMFLANSNQKFAFAKLEFIYAPEKN